MPFWRSNWPAVVVIALSSVVVSRARLPLNATFQTTRARSDVFTLPPSNQLVVMSLGYRSALADLIFAHVLVSSGIHFHEKRAFDLASNYLDAVIALDPKFEAPYRMADGLITLQAKAVSVDAYRQERIAEMGEFIGTIIAGIYEGIRGGHHDRPSDFAAAAGRAHRSLSEVFAAAAASHGTP